MHEQTALNSDETLILRVVRGDVVAFETLIARYKAPILGFLSHTLGDPAEAEDLTQVVFMRVFTSAASYRFSAKFSTWIYAIARNLCLNEIRRRSRHPMDSMSVDESCHDRREARELRQYEESHQPAGPEVLLLKELRQAIEEALATLPKNQRAAVWLSQEEGMPYEDIARVLGISLAATKSLISRGRQKLKRRLVGYIQAGNRPVPVTRRCGSGRFTDAFHPQSVDGPGRRAAPSTRW